MDNNILTLNTYVIGRPQKFALNVAYDCYDQDGTKLFDIKRKIMSEEYSLVDPSGKVFGVIHRKLIAVTPTYDLYDGNKTLIGRVIEEMNLAGNLLGGNGRKFLLEDANGNKIAHVAVTSPLAQILDSALGGQLPNQVSNSSFNVTNMDESEVIAKIGTVRKRIQGIQFGPNYATFILEITGKSVPSLTLIEFAIAVDHLFSSTSNTSFGAPGAPFRNPGMPPSGMGGGGGMKINF
jgi:uncharacterized protein YxjI